MAIVTIANKVTVNRRLRRSSFSTRAWRFIDLFLFMIESSPVASFYAIRESPAGATTKSTTACLIISTASSEPHTLDEAVAVFCNVIARSGLPIREILVVSCVYIRAARRIPLNPVHSLRCSMPNEAVLQQIEIGELIQSVDDGRAATHAVQDTP